MGKIVGRLRRFFVFASNVSTVLGWLSPLIPAAGVISWVVAERQGMTPAGAILFAVVVAALVAVCVYFFGLIFREFLAARRAPRQLQQVYAATQRLYETVVTATDEEHVTLLVVLFNEWTDLVSKWLAANFGMAARARFRMHTVPRPGTWVRWLHTKNEDVISIYDAMSIGLTQQLESLKDMIGTTTWDKMSERKAMAMDEKNRFDELLHAMVHGKPPNVQVPIAQKNAASDQASDAEQPACCDDTQTPQDTSGDASS